MTEAQDIAGLRKFKTHEQQLLGAEIAVMRQLKNEVETATGIARATTNCDMERSIAIIFGAFAMDINRLGQLEAGVARDEAAEMAEGARVGAEDQQATSAGRAEALLDAQEEAVLVDIIKTLKDIDAKGVKEEISPKTYQIRAGILAEIQRLKQDLSKLDQLERVELSDEQKKELLRGQKDPAIISLINSERKFSLLLHKYIDQIEALVKRNENVLVIRKFILRTIQVAEYLIKLNEAEKRRAAT